jgi:hypothetical protein
VAQSSSFADSSDLADVHVDNSAANAKDSFLSLDEHMLGLEPMAGFTTSPDCSLEDVDWPAWETVFNGSGALSPMANSTQVRSPHQPYSGDQTYYDDTLAGHTNSLNCNSRDSSAGTPLCPPYLLSAQSAKGLFTRSSHSISAGPAFSLSQALPTELQAGYALSVLSSPRTAPCRNCESSLQSTPTSRSRCIFQCHVNLANQLAEITEFQVRGSGIALDILLNLDDHVHKARDKILACLFCLATPRLAQTLMLLTMVLDDLLRLFERSCANSVDINTTISPTGISSECITRPRNPLPSTIGPLTVGEIQLDEALKVAFSRRLISMYLNRQLFVVQQFKELLSKSDEGNVNFKITQELLADVSRRSESFVAFITLKDTLEVSTLY